MSKLCLMVLTALLLAALPASADTPQPAPPTAAVTTAGAAQAPALCQATLSPLAQPPRLLSTRPAGQTIQVLCGSCSTPLCAGKPVGVVCETSGTLVWHCLTPPDTACTSDGNDFCTCTRLVH